MSAATQNELDRLYRERDKAREERDALAAHVERFNTLMRELHSESDCGDESGGDPIPAELWELWREKPDTAGLARLKAGWQVAALETAVITAKMKGETEAAMWLQDLADTFRCQAEGGADGEA